ncbi:MAG: lipid-A-disaccharide synthase, partial [Rhodobacteraceae bacterium]|nr:lipid-A-disaccharide synthase [Paracoccaceae bacterium]
MTDPRLFLIAGEASGDRLGAALIAGMRQLAPGVAVSGIGGAAMEAQGLESLFPMQELSVMGLAEVLPRLPALLRRRDEAAAAVLAAKPDALVTIDSPDFCLRVAARVRRASPRLPVVHYVAPSVWAWRPGRARRMAAHVDHVLALLPFEPPYMTAAGMGCDFVGHPVVAEPVADASSCSALWAELGIGPDEDALVVLPGSRRGEVARLAPVFGAALARLAAAGHRPRVIVPAARDVAGQVAEAIRGWPGAPVLLDPRGLGAEEAEARKRAAFRLARGALAASGTVSLELAAAGCPMVIAYDMAPLSRLIMGAMLRVDTVTLVNLVSETRAVPEFIGRDCRPEAIA